MDVCKECGHKLKRCSNCKVIQTPENSIISGGKFQSTCKKCTAERVLRIRYDKMQVCELEGLLKKHSDTVEQLKSYLSDRRRRESVDI